jgi:hypothetical protein
MGLVMGHVAFVLGDPKQARYQERVSNGISYCGPGLSCAAIR